MEYHNFTTGNSLLDQSVEYYLMYGLEPGGFITAVLSNNLFLAASRGDYINSQNLATITKAIWFNCPADSFGSLELVREWMRDKDGIRSRYAAIKEKEYTFRALKGTLNEKVDPISF